MSNDLVSIRERLKADAQKAASQEVVRGQFFKMRAGQLSFDGREIPNNTMGVVILSSLFENVYYGGEFDSDTPTPPECFAFSAEGEEGMAPHPTVVVDGRAKHAECRTCPMNAWGSSDKGKGKACKNTRRLAMIPAGTFDNKSVFTPYGLDDLKAANVGYMRLPVTSVTNYGNYVKQAATVLGLPPYALFTKVYVKPDRKTQFKIHFEVISEIPDDCLADIHARHEEVSATIDFPYSRPSDEAPAQEKKVVKRGRY